MKIALVHDWFTGIGGGEKVSREIILMFPDIDVYTLVDSMTGDDKNFILGNKKPFTSIIQNLPFSKKYYRHYLPLYPYAIEQFDLNKYDVVISSSSSVAKGVMTHSNQVHICYCHSPMRYAWDLYHQYLKEVKLTRGLSSTAFKIVLHFIRMWDYYSSQRVDYFIANSVNVAKRIKKVYNRSSKVIYPPVDIDSLGISEIKEDFYVTVSRIVPYKRTDLLVEAFAQMPDKNLVIIGNGPYAKKIAKRIKVLKAKNIKMTGYIHISKMREYLQQAKAFVFAAEEDFGITPLEAMACGTPVLAFGKGGILETVVEGKTGLFFAEQTAESLIDCIMSFEKYGVDFTPLEIRDHTVKFRSQRFRNEFMNFLDEVVNKKHE